MKKKLIFAASFISLFFSTALLSEEIATVPIKTAYSLNELVERSLANYELLKTSASAIDQYRYQKEQAAAWQNPEIEFSGGLKKGPSSTGYLYGLSLSQNILFPGKLRLNREIIGHDETLARLSHEEMRLYVSYEVVRLGSRYRAMKEKSLLSRERLQRLRLIETYLKSRPILSPEKIVEKNIIQARVKMLEKDMIEIRQNMREAFNELNIFTCFCVDEEIFPEIIVNWIESAPALDEASMRNTALSNNHAILLQREMVGRSRTLTAFEKKKNDPDVRLSIFFNEEKITEREMSVGGGIALPIPVIDRNSNGIKAGEVRTRMEQQRLLYIERNLARVLSILFAEYGTASELMQKFRMSDREDIDRAMRYADGEFMRGRVGLQTYLEMDTQSHEVLEALYEAQLRLIDAYTGILYQSAIDKNGRIFSNDK